MKQQVAQTYFGPWKDHEVNVLELHFKTNEKSDEVLQIVGSLFQGVCLFVCLFVFFKGCFIPVSPNTLISGWATAVWSDRKLNSKKMLRDHI